MNSHILPMSARMHYPGNVAVSHTHCIYTLVCVYTASVFDPSSGNKTTTSHYHLVRKPWATTVIHPEQNSDSQSVVSVGPNQDTSFVRRRWEGKALPSAKRRCVCKCLTGTTHMPITQPRGDCCTWVPETAVSVASASSKEGTPKNPV